MNLRYKIVIANLFSLILPSVVYSIVRYTGAYDNTTIGFLYLAHILIPFAFFLVFFREDSLLRGFPQGMVYWRTVIACITWTVAIGLESQYRDYIDLAIIPALAVKLFGETVLPPRVPQMNYLIPAYDTLFIGLVLFYDIIFLTLATFFSDCGKNKRQCC